MGRKSSRIPFSPERVNQAIKYAGLKKKDLFPEKYDERQDNDQMLSRSYRRCESDRKIKPANLEWLARKLNVATAYLKGELDWPLEQLDDELRKAYTERILDPARFPYRGWYQLRSEIDYEQYEKQLLESHGINYSRLSSLSSGQRISLLEGIDVAICRKLRRYFPECMFIDYLREYDISDIVEALIDPPDDAFSDEDADDDADLFEDRFAAKHMGEYDVKMLWGHRCVLDLVADGCEASNWQASAISALFDEWDAVNNSADELRRYLRDNCSAFFGDDNDLWWTIHPIALVASESCTRDNRIVAIRCDCRIGSHRQLDVRFLNEELEGFYLD